jgi:hypothetical protein
MWPDNDKDPVQEFNTGIYEAEAAELASWKWFLRPEETQKLPGGMRGSTEGLGGAPKHFFAPGMSPSAFGKALKLS